MSIGLREPRLEQPDYSCPTCTEGCDDGVIISIIAEVRRRLGVCSCWCHDPGGFEAEVADSKYRNGEWGK